MTISGSGCTNGLCYCTGSQPLELTCEVYSLPTPTYQWCWNNLLQIEYFGNQVIRVTYDGTYSCTASNSFSMATVSVGVFNCCKYNSCVSFKEFRSYQMHTYMYVSAFVRVCACVQLCVHVCVWVCVCANVYLDVCGCAWVQVVLHLHHANNSCEVTAKISKEHFLSRCKTCNAAAMVD